MPVVTNAIRYDTISNPDDVFTATRIAVPLLLLLPSSIVLSSNGMEFQKCGMLFIYAVADTLPKRGKNNRGVRLLAGKLHAAGNEGGERRLGLVSSLGKNIGVRIWKPLETKKHEIKNTV